MTSNKEVKGPINVARRAHLEEALRSRRAQQNMRRGWILSPRARGAEPQAYHGPLQRLLGGIDPDAMVLSITT
jgi:hypothetical protein